MPTICVVGPTAVGKTRLAIMLARRFDGEIINADSRQVYRDMEIGTAKPSPDDRAAAPHHLVDFLDLSESFGLVLFLNLAQEAARQIVGRRRLPIVAGGSGQYVWGLLEGDGPPEAPPDLEFRRALEQEAAAGGGESLHKRLRNVDPVRAAAIDPRNIRRVIRALEIFSSTGRKPSASLPSPRPALDSPLGPVFDPLIIGLTMDRRELYRRIDDRVDRMMEQGLLREVETLAAAGHAPGQGPLGSPGYRELGLYLSGEMTLEEAAKRTKTQTHRLARRQYTWFKPDDPRITWLDATRPDLDEEAVRLVSLFLESRPPVLQ